MCWSPVYALLMLTSTTITYISGFAIEKVRTLASDESEKKKFEKISVFFSFFLNLSILFFFKYFNFFNDSIRNALAHFNITWSLNNFDILLPVGISFYTFHALGYTLDIYRGEVKHERNFGKYALFVAFFPQLVAGPIGRSTQLLAQFSENHKFDIDRIKSGMMLILWGLFQKIMIADRLSILVNTVYNNPSQHTGFEIVIATVFFSFQLLCDFSAYTDIATGTSKIMGIDLVRNFNKPYFATSIKDFWRRWHMSLSTWFRDYLYFPLGGSKHGINKTYRNIFIVFVVSGLWHGASWTFVIWGALHGIYQILAMASSKYTDMLIKKLQIDPGGASLKIFNTILTFSLVSFTWIFFRANNFHDAIILVTNIFKLSNVHVLFTDDLYKLGLNDFEFRLSVLLILTLCIVNYFQSTESVIRVYIMKLWPPFQWVLCTAVVLFMLVYGIYGNTYNAAQFIYFQF